MDSPFDGYDLDPEEQDILDSFERGEWSVVAAANLARFKEYASAQLAETELRISLPNDEAVRLQQRASSLGINASELAAQIIHTSLYPEEQYVP